MTNSTSNKSRKVAPSFEVSNDRLNRAAALTTGQGEDVSVKPQTASPEPEVKQINDKSYKACIVYMQENGITDPNSLNFKRLNCEIPLELHNFLNVMGRTSSEYSSMTEIVIRVMGQFAKEHGFKVGNK